MSLEQDEGGQLISLDARRRREEEYVRVLQDVRQRVEEIQSELFDLAVAVAFAGPLREWSEAQAVGTVTWVDDEHLNATKDKAVLALLRLRDGAAVTTECFEPRLE
jgi:hypothetical protein